MIAQTPFAHAADVHPVPFGGRDMPDGTRAMIGMTRWGGGGDVFDMRHSSAGTTWSVREPGGTVRQHGMPTPPPPTRVIVP